MCEYCGCQEVAAIAQLTAEHDLVVELSAAVQRSLEAGALDAAAEWTRSLAAALGPHLAVEEEALFPAMSGEFADHVAGLVDEHRMFDAILAESALLTPVDPTWPARLLDAVDLLREHIIKEQDGLFPAALVILDPDDWERLDAVRARVGTALSVTLAGVRR